MCIFCSIIKGDIPSSKVYEDDKVIAILDISQTTKGHTLVIPKKHYDNVLEMPKDEYLYLMEVAQKIAKHLVDKLNATGLNILVNTNESAGQTVMHTHIHLIPRYDNSDTIKIQFVENRLDLNDVLNKVKMN